MRAHVNIDRWLSSVMLVCKNAKMQLSPSGMRCGAKAITCNSYNMGTSDLPNMYAQSPRAAGIHIRQIMSAYVTTTVMALLFTGRYFHKFHEKVAFHENIIVNSYAPSCLAIMLYTS